MGRSIPTFLGTYTTPNATREAMREFRSCAPRLNETETEYGTRLGKAGTRCSNFFSNGKRKAHLSTGLTMQ